MLQRVVRIVGPTSFPSNLDKCRPHSHSEGVTHLRRHTRHNNPCQETNNYTLCEKRATEPYLRLGRNLEVHAAHL